MTDPRVLMKYFPGSTRAGFEFARPSPAYQRGQDGVWREVGPDVLRDDHWELDEASGLLVRTTLIEDEGENLIPGNRQKFEGWQAYMGATATITQGQTIAPTATAPGSPEGAATRIQTIGGTHVLKYLVSVGPASEGEVVSISVLVHNQGAHPAVIRPATNSVSETVQPGQTRRVEATFVHPEGLYRQIQIRATDPAHDLDFLAWAPQIELTPYATSPILDPTASSPNRTTRAADLLTWDPIP